MRSWLLRARLASLACSSGRNTLTSPAPGLRVPIKAMTSSGGKALKPAKPAPVAAISNAAANSSVRGATRWPQAPTASVARADPSSVAVLSTPTIRLPWPSASR